MSDAQTVAKVLTRGVALNCPRCGKGKLFAGYLKRRECCESCGESFVGLDADDGPAWLTIGVTAHIVIPLLIFFEQRQMFSYGAEFAVVALVAIASALALLPVSKGLFIAALWKIRQKKN